MKFVPDSIMRTVSRQGLLLQKNMPHIMFGAGMVGVVGSAIMACRATLKLHDTLDNAKEELYRLEPTESNYKQDVVKAYSDISLEFVKLYGPSLAVGALSLASLTSAHVSLSRRNKALIVTLAAVTKAYDEYRARVREEIGEKRENELFYNAHTEKDPQTKEELTVIEGDPSQYSIYARFFDEASTEWKKDPEYNRIFVQCQQNYANQLLASRGHVFLNEVYDMLGLERSQAGQVVGWIWNGDGDNFIDFSMFKPETSRFINGWERSILLDFNVDGVIYDKI